MKWVTQFVEQTCSTDYHRVFRYAEEGPRWQNMLQVNRYTKFRCRSPRKKAEISEMSTSWLRYVQILEIQFSVFSVRIGLSSLTWQIPASYTVFRTKWREIILVIFCGNKKMGVKAERTPRICHCGWKKKPASLGYPPSVFNKNFTLKCLVNFWPRTMNTKIFFLTVLATQRLRREVRGVARRQTYKNFGVRTQLFPRHTTCPRLVSSHLQVPPLLPWPVFLWLVAWCGQRSCMLSCSSMHPRRVTWWLRNVHVSRVTTWRS